MLPSQQILSRHAKEGRLFLASLSSPLSTSWVLHRSFQLPLDSSGLGAFTCLHACAPAHENEPG